MPAIQPARLKNDAVEAAAAMHDPDLFITRLSGYLDTYADRVLRPGKASPSPSILPTYHLPAPALRQLLLGTKAYAKSNPEQTLGLVDRLWETPILEYYLIAIGLLTQIPPIFEEAIYDRLTAWLQPNLDESVIDAMLETLLPLLSKHSVEALLEKIEDDLLSRQAEKSTYAFHILHAIVSAPKFTNLPRVYNMLTPLVRDPHPDIRSHLVTICDALADRSPGETGYFLQTSYYSSNNPGTAWLIRQLLTRFSPETQAELRETLRS